MPNLPMLHVMDENETQATSSNGNESARYPGMPITGPFAQQEPAPPERPKRGRMAQRRYFLWMRLSRLTLGAFIFIGAVTLLWLIPWLPTGIDTSNFSPQAEFTVYLLAGAVGLAFLLLSFQELARRDRQTLAAWATVYDEATGLHNRSYLFDRLALECDRAQRTPEPFSVIVLQFHRLSSRTKNKNKPLLSTSALEKIAELINSVTHATDLVGLLSGSELAVLAVRVDREKRHTLQQRLQHTVATALPDLVGQPDRIDVRCGGATYGQDGTEPGGLIQAARTSATLGVRQHMKVA